MKKYSIVVLVWALLPIPASSDNGGTDEEPILFFMTEVPRILTCDSVEILASIWQNPADTYKEVEERGCRHLPLPVLDCNWESPKVKSYEQYLIAVFQCVLPEDVALHEDIPLTQFIARYRIKKHAEPELHI
ncbi:MAG: hypothetical protein LR017_03520 [Candidatus Pacebacteria bacterium]|nr:hypothetical protein [Candidatus Paceibacterota bacterium]